MTTAISGSSGITFPAGGTGNPAGTVVGTSDTQTLTNKTINGSQLVAGSVTNTQIATSSQSIGSGQTWTNVTASRSAGTTYTNSTGRSIQVAILSAQGTNQQFQFYIDSTLVWNQYSSTIYGDNVSANFILPPSATYSLTVPYGSIQFWMELR
jgi:hypothetical protein